MNRLGAALAAVAVAACGHDPAPGVDPAGDRDGSIDESGGCARPERGCACEPGSAPMDCYLEPERADGEMVCHAGTRHCRDGRWSGCEDLREFSLEWTDGLGALISGPDACNPCNPDCSLSQDYPVEEDLSDDNSYRVVYEPVFEGVILAPVDPTYGLKDSDDDGVADVVDDCPDTSGKEEHFGCPSGEQEGFVLMLPHDGPSQLRSLPFDVEVTAADVYFLVDTTYAMGSPIDLLQRDLTSGEFVDGCDGGVLGAIDCMIPDARFGVGRHDDYPEVPHGWSGFGDRVYENQLDMTADPAAAQGAVDALATRYGYDWADSQSQALWAMATGDGLGDYLTARTGCDDGTWGYPCFRSDSLPVVVLFTDSPFHNGPNPDYDYAPFTVEVPPATPVAANENQVLAHDIGDVVDRWVGFSGNTCAMVDDYDDVGCFGRNSPDAVFELDVSRAETISISLQGSDYPWVASLRNAAFEPMDCMDWFRSTGVEVTLDPGTYYLVVDGYGTDTSSYCGDYRLSIGMPPEEAKPVSWAEAVAALAARDVKTLCVESSGGYLDARDDCETLASATGSVDGDGNPLVFSTDFDGTGLAEAVVDGVRELATRTRYDVRVRPRDDPDTADVDERDFVHSIELSDPDGGCEGLGDDWVFEQCLPGTSVELELRFHNGFVEPTGDTQVFELEIELLLGDTVQKRVPVRIVVPPTSPVFAPSGRYWRDYDATIRCEVPTERPDWGEFRWDTRTPGDTAIRFEFQTADSTTGLASAPVVAAAIPPRDEAGSLDLGELLRSEGEINGKPYARATAVLLPSDDQMTTPVLDGFELRYTCSAAE